MDFNKLLLNNNISKKVMDLIKEGENAVIEGLDNSRLMYFIGNLYQGIDNHVFLIAYDYSHLLSYYEDLIRLVDKDKIVIYPDMEILPHEQIVVDMQELGARMKILEELIFQTDKKKIILITVETLMRKMMPVDSFMDFCLQLELGEEIDLSELSSRLSFLGYERVNMVENQGEYSIRGGILDLYTISSNKPFRIEFFGDELDSIRAFDINTQRSELNKEQITISPAREIIIPIEKRDEVLKKIKEDYYRAVDNLIKLDSRDEAEYLREKMKDSLTRLEEFHYFPAYEQFLPYFYDTLDSFFDYIPKDSILFFSQTERVWERVKKYKKEMSENTATLLEQGSVLPSYISNFLTDAEFKLASDNFTSLYFFSRTIQKKPQLVSSNIELELKTRGVEPFHGKVELLAESLKSIINQKYRVVITLNSSSKAKRITKFLKEKELPALFKDGSFRQGEIIVKAGSLAEGFVFEEEKICVFTEKEVFGKRQKQKMQIKDVEEGVKISSINELTVGDYVVHENHGIGKYLGVKTMEIRNQHLDYLLIKYADGDKLYVPTEQFNLVQKYIGADHAAPKLYKLGGSKWKNVKQKVQNSVKEMAIGLLELYAERETVEGYAFSEDTVWQDEFEEAFPYEETTDQLRSIKEVKKDMEDNSPMDRLLCGDVGYGKTEVAIRAAFKAVMEGKQVAILVPTTILAQQHYNTFSERLNNYPINIEMISRFRTAKEQKDVLKYLAVGKVDIIIGTHRLLSKDIVFKDLGLLVVDEEQRFGVTHKEKLKDFKKNVDVLTLTATPIPRTLHMALVGVRDMSVIETPPENRYPIRTYIREYNAELVRDAIRKEISREGQVYFVHNRVEDIEDKAGKIRNLVPGCRVAVAHGQMKEQRLEKIMLDFYHQKYDVLVCTTIIETGLDLPSVNTIIINKADHMGLAQLYQLRGRVGRSNKIAYAYLLYERDRILPEIAEKRLKAIKEFTNLGSGFKIAMRDLEIRGAGNLLGPEQHGHIASVGFSLYCKLLENAVEELKGQKKEEEKELEIKLDIDAYLPDKYISDSQQKISIYKKIMNIKDDSDYTEILDEIIDRFGEPPEEVVNLLKISILRIKVRSLGISKVEQKGAMIYCYYTDSNKFDGENIFKLIDKYPKRIKIKTGEQVILGFKLRDISRFEKIIDDYIKIKLVNK
ncbi:transcription-repair coupling factor [Natronospora cellulosivora (SeqCode)]